MPRDGPVAVVRELTSRGYNADREAVTLLAREPDPAAAVDRAVEAAPDDALRLTADDVRDALRNPSLSTGTQTPPNDDAGTESPPETEGVDSGPTESPTGESTASGANGNGSGNGTASSPGSEATSTSTDADSRTHGTGTTGDPSNGTVESSAGRDVDPSLRSLSIDGDVTDRSTGTGEYEDFVKVFRDRFEKLSKQLRSRVNHRPTGALESMPGGSDAGIVGMVNDVRSTASGHWLVELEDTSGTFPALIMKDREFADAVDELLYDEVIAVEGTLSDDGGILFVDSLHFPDVARTYRPSTADREVQAALVSDVHVGSQEFEAGAWSRFADWLHQPEAETVEYLLVAGDMVEGVGVYPDQDEELDVVDIYEQYETFAEHLKDVPGDMEIVMIPGNHDAVRLAEPQPGFDEELRDIMSAHDARITGNPSTVTVEGVSVLMYHGVSLDEVIAELPEEKASYDEPHRAMYQLLKKRHLAPQYGGRNRIAPEERDYLVIEETPDVFHTGHVHKLGVGKYHNVTAVNSGCWQAQTAFQESVNIDPDVGVAPILDLDTLDVTLHKFL